MLSVLMREILSSEENEQPSPRRRKEHNIFSYVSASFLPVASVNCANMARAKEAPSEIS